MKQTSPKIAIVFVFAPLIVCMATLPQAPTRSPALAAETMLADSAETWEALISDQDVQDILAIELEGISRSLKTSGFFQRDRKTVETVGRIVAVLGNIGAVKSQGADKKAAALREAGMALAAAAEKKDHDAAQKAAEAIKSYPDSIEPAADGKPVAWTDLLTSAVLMKQVAEIDKAVGETNKQAGRSFAKAAKPMARRAQLLACLAVVERELNGAADWKEWCDTFREGAFKLAIAYHKGNQKGAVEARTQLEDNCVACHRAYRTN